MKEFLLELIDFVRYKVENDKVTISDLNTFYRFLCRNIRVQATIKDISDFFGQSESNVRNVTTRHVCSKPTRFVYYDFVEVLNSVPRSWLGKRSKSRNKIKIHENTGRQRPRRVHQRKAQPGRAADGVQVLPRDSA